LLLSFGISISKVTLMNITGELKRNDVHKVCLLGTCEKKWSYLLSSISSVLVYIHYQKCIFTVFSLLNSKVTEVWGFSVRSRDQGAEDCTYPPPLRSQYIFVTPINQWFFKFPTFISSTYKIGLKRKVFLPFNIFELPVLGIKSIFGAYCLTGLKNISCDSIDLLFWIAITF
jgi:hypothetical protein